MSKLGCVGLGKKLQRQKKGPWSLGERKAKATGSWGEEEGGDHANHSFFKSIHTT